MIHNNLCELRCIWYFKGTNSKANHNIDGYTGETLDGVFGISKVQIQKQITTTNNPFLQSY